MRDSNSRLSPCKRAALPTELTRRRTIDPNPGVLRGVYDDMESGARFELAISWIAARRHTNLTTRSIAGRQRTELCPPDLESSSATRTRPIQKTRTESPERPENMEHGKHDFFFGGSGGIRILNRLLARQLLSQLSYAPVVTVFAAPIWGLYGRYGNCLLVAGCTGFEPATFRLTTDCATELRQHPVGIRTAIGIRVMV